MENKLIYHLTVSVLIEYFKHVKRKLTLSFVIIVLLCSSLYAQDTNRALNFDGVNDYVNMNDVLNNLPLPFTAEAWVYWRGATTTAYAEYGIITSDNDPQFYYRGFCIRVLNQGQITIRLGDGGIAAGFSRRDKNSPANALPVNAWTHIAVVVRGLTDMSIFVNGIDVGGTYDGSGGNMQSSGHPFIIGRWTYDQSTGQDWFFNGIIDEVRIWRIERTQAQIISKMNQTLGQEYYITLDSGLVGYWRFDQLENLGINGGGIDDVRDIAVFHQHGDTENGPVIVLGAPTLIGIQQILIEFPNQFTLNQNFPNPFNPVTHIEFSIPKKSNVKITVYDSQGKEVADLLNQRLTSGTYKVDFDGANFSSGVYFYKLETEDFVQTKSMVLLK